MIIVIIHTINMGISDSKQFYLNYNITKKEFCKFYFDETNNYDLENRKLIEICKWSPTDTVVQILSAVNKSGGDSPNPIFLQGGSTYRSVFVAYRKAKENENDPISESVENIFGYDGTNTVDHLVLVEDATNTGRYYSDDEFKPVLNQLLVLNYNLTKLQSLAYIETVHVNDLSTACNLKQLDTVLADGRWNPVSKKRKMVTDKNSAVQENPSKKVSTADKTVSDKTSDKTIAPNKVPTTSSKTTRQYSSNKSDSPNKPGDESGDPVIVNLDNEEHANMSNNTIVQVIINFSNAEILNTKTFDLMNRSDLMDNVCDALHVEMQNHVAFMLNNTLNRAYTAQIKRKKFTGTDFGEAVDCMVDTIVVTNKNPNLTKPVTTYNRKDFTMVRIIDSKYSNFL